MSRTSKATAIAQLNAIQRGDPEAAHSRADKILLAHVHPDVAAAYERVKDECSYWATS